MKTADVSAASGTEGFTIKPDTKKIITKDDTFTYTEKGNQITWSDYGAIDVGDVFGINWVYKLDRLSGELEKDIGKTLIVAKTEGFDMQDFLLSLKDAENYTLFLTHYAKCNKVEALF